MTDRHYSRRRFLVITCGAAAGLLCAGCAGQAAAEDVVPVSATSAPAASTPVASTPKQSACPKGLVNDPYPGRCRLYRDTNGNGYCDYSEV